MFSFQGSCSKRNPRGKLKFGEKFKSQMKIDSDPLQVVDAHYSEPTGFDNTVNMVEVTEDFINEAVMVKITEDLDHKFMENFRCEVVDHIAKGNADNHNLRVTEDFDGGITEGSSWMMVTKETADGFIRMDKVVDGLDVDFNKLSITNDVNMDINMV